MVRPFRLDDNSAVAVPSEPTISPDGNQIVYVLRTTDAGRDLDRHALWTVRTNGQSWSEPVPLTHGRADTAPAFSPTGTELAFLRAEDGPAQVWLSPVGGGEPRALTDLVDGAGPPVWSPDGTCIAFTAPVRFDRGGSGDTQSPRTADQHAPVSTTRLGYKADGSGLFGLLRQHLHVLTVRTGELVQVSAGDWHAGPPAWSPDGARLAFAAAPEADADADRCGPAPTSSTPPAGPCAGSGRAAASPDPCCSPPTGGRCWSPDGRRSASATPLCCGSRSTIPTTRAPTWPPLWTAT